MNTDEGTGFLDDMTKKEVKHECHVPANSTCISISVQPQPFCKALAKMQRLENGFGERFT